jgi:hypothetical protein
MPVEYEEFRKQFHTGVVVLSLDTEQIWGYLDQMNEMQFRNRYPDALEAHDRLLACLTSAGVSATWFTVGGMALHGSHGAQDRRMAALPKDWTERIRAGAEETTPLWYRPSFVERLRQALPFQEVGLHGGLTHLIWTDGRSTKDAIKEELAEGLEALEHARVHPTSFSFPREQEAHHRLLPAHGIRCYRGRNVTRAFQMGPSLAGKMARLLDEMCRATPPPVWPEETLPGLWNIPSSLFLYPIGGCRTSVVGLNSRVERFKRGVEAAARLRGIFHFCLHPENLTESKHGFSMFEEMLDRLTRARLRGDIEILTMGEVVARMERGMNRLSVPALDTKGPIYDSPKQYSHS